MLEFKIGNIVVLKSGGPLMTVVDAKDGNVKCLWYAGSTYESESFLSDMIVIASPELTRWLLGDAMSKYYGKEIR